LTNPSCMAGKEEKSKEGTSMSRRFLQEGGNKTMDIAGKRSSPGPNSKVYGDMHVGKSWERS